MVCALAVLLGVALPFAQAAALVFASPDTEPQEERPADFPYWDHVTQRRYEGPTVLYLGQGFALTARHVGMGEVLLGDQIVEPVPGSKRTLLNVDGSAADAMIFGLEQPSDSNEWPLLPIATEPLRPGEDVLMIGFGRGREKVTEFDVDGQQQFGFTWSKKGRKRWGTNRVNSRPELLNQGSFRTRAISLFFDPPHSLSSTRHEAQAAVGDSGGAIFVKRDGEWLLGAMMISVSGLARDSEKTTLYGDITYAVDLSHYRAQILRWTRPACSNELDDDGDEQIDFPFDPGCETAKDRNERDTSLLRDPNLLIGLAATLVALAIGFWVVQSRR